MPRVHLYTPAWLQRRQRLEQPNLNLSQVFNRALIAELEGDQAVYLCEKCGEKTARALRIERASSEAEVHARDVSPEPGLREESA